MANLFNGGGLVVPSKPSIPLGNLSPFGLVGLPNLSIQQVFLGAAAIGDHALFTVPTGKRALIEVTVHNTSVGNIACTPEISFDAGVSFIALSGTTSPATGATSSAISFEYIAEAGEIFGLKTATNNGANIYAIVYLFDAKATAPKSIKLKSGFVDGNNTIYTCPVGKKSFTIFGYGNIISGNATSPAIVTTTSIAVAAVSFNLVPNGGAVATSNRIFLGTVNLVNGPSIFAVFTPGDFLSLNIPAGNAANFKLAWFTIQEN